MKISVCVIYELVFTCAENIVWHAHIMHWRLCLVLIVSVQDGDLKSVQCGMFFKLNVCIMWLAGKQHNV